MIQLIITRHDLHFIHEIFVQHRLQYLNLLNIELEPFRLRNKEVVSLIDLYAHLFVLLHACACQVQLKNRHDFLVQLDGVERVGDL